MALRQAAGNKKGPSPSKMITQASAIQMLSESSMEWRGRKKVQRSDQRDALPLLRMALKKSEEAGSITTTSLFLAKLDL